MSASLFALALAPVVIWLYLLWFRGGFWRADQRLDAEVSGPRSWPAVVAVMPARNEAQVIGRAIASLLGQDYPGEVKLVVVDDDSDDRTAALAAEAAARAGGPGRLTLIRASEVPPGWTGKLWALAQGVRSAESLAPDAPFLLFTDADVEHDRATLRRLVAKATAEGRDLVSLMVLLPCRDPWERLLIPAFVFFFQKLYPHPRVNDPRAAAAAAAGGCMLVRRSALARAGGIEAIRGELVDDLALARAIKAQGPIWLGLTDTSVGLRRYRGLEEIWNMVARTAYHQLGYSPLLLAGAVIGMTLSYLVPPLAAVIGPMTGEAALAPPGIVAWLLMMRCYGPTLRLYRRPWLSGLGLPVAALFFLLMTIDSARRHRLGRGGAWKGRTYSGRAGPGRGGSSRA